MQMQIIIEHILRDEKVDMLKVNHKMVIYMLSSFMGNKKICWPSHPELARCCGMSISTLIRTLKTLEKMKIVCVERNHNQNNVYSFNEMWVSNCNSIRVNMTPQRVKLTPPGVSDCYPNNINNNINNNKLSLVKKRSTEYIEGGHENGDLSPLLKSYLNKK